MDQAEINFNDTPTAKPNLYPYIQERAVPNMSGSPLLDEPSDNTLKDLMELADYFKERPLNKPDVAVSKAPAYKEITAVSNGLRDLLIYKNEKYGNSALNPINVFSKADSETGLLQRLDDKIARIQTSPELRKNDVADVMGYLILLCVKKGWFSFSEFKD